MKRKCDRSVGGPVDDKVVRVKLLLRGLTLILRHHDCPRQVIESFKNQTTPYLTVNDEITFISRAKHMMLWPMAYYLGNCAPKPADECLRWSGAWRRWSRQRLRHFSKKNTHLWYSFLQGKRSAKTVSKQIVLQNYLKHRKQMLEPDPIDTFAEMKVMELLDPVLEQIGSSLRKRHSNLLLDPYPIKQPPSLSAASSYLDRSVVKPDQRHGKDPFHKAGTRREGGSRGILRYLMGFDPSEDEPFNCHDEYPILQREETELHSMLLLQGITRVANSLQQLVVVEIRHRTGEEQELADIFKTAAREFYYNPRSLRAEICAVLEPLKVRTISKGEAVYYTMAKRFQKALHGVMRRRPEFRLIGRPLCPTDLMDIRSNFENVYGRVETEDSFWLSVDYSAATDGLSATLSSSIMNRILEYSGISLLQKEYAAVIRQTLLPHKISYPMFNGKVVSDNEVLAAVEAADYPYRLEHSKVKGWEHYWKIPSVQQINGQLMGSITSFPILCLANLGLYLWVRSLTRNQNLKNMLKTVLINGDDMLYEGSEEEFELHELLGERIGLRQAPGKSYVHKTYANMNSMCFHYPRNRRVSHTPRYIPFLNTGLFYGQHKVLGKADTDDKSPIGRKCSVFNKVVEGAWNGKQRDIAKQYMALHRHKIKEECRGRNLFIPVSLGGMGVEPWLEPRLNKYQYDLIRRCQSRTGTMNASRPFNRYVAVGSLGEIPSSCVFVRDHLALAPDTVHRMPRPKRGFEVQYDPNGLTDGLLTTPQPQFCNEDVIPIGCQNHYLPGDGESQLESLVCSAGSRECGAKAPRRSPFVFGDSPSLDYPLYINFMDGLF